MCRDALEEENLAEVTSVRSTRRRRSKARRPKFSHVAAWEWNGHRQTADPGILKSEIRNINLQLVLQIEVDDEYRQKK